MPTLTNVKSIRKLLDEMKTLRNTLYYMRTKSCKCPSCGKVLDAEEISSCESCLTLVCIHCKKLYSEDLMYICNTCWEAAHNPEN